MKPSMQWLDITAIILASGKGIRFGKPKADAVLDGLTFLETISQTIQNAGINKLFVASYADTPDMLSTLRRAKREFCADDTANILVFPVDFPYVKSSTVELLCKTSREHPDMIVRPVFQGKPGHPIILPSGFDLNIPDLGQGLRGIIKSSSWIIRDVYVEDSGIQRNINTTNDLDDDNEHL